MVQSGSIRALGARGRRFKSYLPDARVAQLVEQGSCKAQVVGSNPISGSRVSYNGNTSAFQADAVGSIPSTRSYDLTCADARVVKGADCKSVIRRFESDSALK